MEKRECVFSGKVLRREEGRFPMVVWCLGWLDFDTGSTLRLGWVTVRGEAEGRTDTCREREKERERKRVSEWVTQGVQGGIGSHQYYWQ